MHLLHLSPYPVYPPRSGGALRIYNLLRGVALQHRVTHLVFTPDMAAWRAMQPLAAYARLLPVQGVPPRSTAHRLWTLATSTQPDLAHRNAAAHYTAALRQLVQHTPYDAVLIESLEMAQYGLWLRRHLPPTQCPTLILDTFNAEYVLQRRAAATDARQLRPTTLAKAGYSLLQWQRLAAHERRALHQFDHIIAVSHEDRAALQRLAPHNSTPISIVPNGVDTGYFQPTAMPPTAAPPTLVFTGTLDYRPNIDGIVWFVQHVLPRIRQQQPAVRLLIVGRSPSATVQALHDGQQIVVQRDVPDVRPAMAAATVYIVPLRVGGGIRLKVLEALAMQAAVVSTPLGVEGIPQLEDGQHALLAADAPAFAAAVLRLLHEPATRHQLGAAGRSMVQQHYDWDVLVPRLLTVLADPTTAVVT